MKILFAFLLLPITLLAQYAPLNENGTIDFKYLPAQPFTPLQIASLKTFKGFDSTTSVPLTIYYTLKDGFYWGRVDTAINVAEPIPTGSITWRLPYSNADMAFNVSTNVINGSGGFEIVINNFESDGIVIGLDENKEADYYYNWKYAALTYFGGIYYNVKDAKPKYTDENIAHLEKIRLYRNITTGVVTLDRFTDNRWINVHIFGAKSAIPLYLKIAFFKSGQAKKLISPKIL